MRRSSGATICRKLRNHYKHALELDPKLAMAWARLGVLYLNSDQNSKAAEYFTRAHHLSGDVSEREKLYIAATTKPQ